MTNEIPGSPRRNGMVCWQIRHERQSDGSLKMRREYAMPDQLDQVSALVDQVTLIAVEPTTRRGIRAATQGSLI